MDIMFVKYVEIFQVEILRNAIMYIQSLERCLGINLDSEEKKENVEDARNTRQHVLSTTFSEPEFGHFNKSMDEDQSVTSMSLSQRRQFQSEL